MSHSFTGRRYQSVRDTDETVDLPIVMEATDDGIEALFRAHYRRVCRVIYRVVGQADLAQALAGEAFWKLHRKRPSHLTNPEAWLCRAGVRLALDHLRTERRRQHYEAIDARTSRASADALSEPAAPPESEERLAREEERVTVRRVLAAMKPTQAALLLLRAEGMTYGELAAALRLNPASIGTMIARAEARFKQIYEARHGHN